MADYTRIEQFLNGILNDSGVPEPYTRIEKLLAAIAVRIGAISFSAAEISYDNTASGLTATNVQDAIDELAPSDNTPVEVVEEGD